MAQSGAHRKREQIIDDNLKRVYDETIEEGVPDRFRILLDALKQEEQGKAKRE